MHLTVLYLLALPVLTGTHPFRFWKTFPFARGQIQYHEDPNRPLNWGEVINDTSKAFPNETVPHQVNRIQYHNDPNDPIRPRDNLTIENSNSSSGTNVSSAQNGIKFEAINTDQNSDAEAEVAYLSHLATFKYTPEYTHKYTHDKNTVKSTEPKLNKSI
jgi:hypothetical protein